MSKYVSLRDSSGYSFSHTFTDADWRQLSSLQGRRSGRVELSEGVATTDGETVMVTLRNGTGSRHHDLPASALFN